jgi:hypothetical protein
MAALMQFTAGRIPRASATAQTNRPSTSDTIVGVLRTVGAHRVTIESNGDGTARTYRIGVLTTVCYEPNLCLGSGDTTPLLPGAVVTAWVATNKRGVAHASTIFVTSVSATIRVDSVNGDLISGTDTRSEERYTILCGPRTILVDSQGRQVRGAVPNIAIGSVLYFTGLTGLDRGSPVTIGVRLFP